MDSADIRAWGDARKSFFDILADAIILFKCVAFYVRMLLTTGTSHMIMISQSQRFMPRQL